MSCGYGTVWHVIWWNVLSVELEWKVKSHLDFTGSFYLQFNGSRVIRVIEGSCEDTPTSNSLRLRQNGHHFPYDIFKCICVYENIWISIKFSLKFVIKVQFTIFQHWSRKWLRTGQVTSHYLSQWWPSLLTLTCVIRTQCVNAWEKHGTTNLEHVNHLLDQLLWIERKIEFEFCILSHHCEGACSWNPSSWKMRTLSSSVSIS